MFIDGLLDAVPQGLEDWRLFHCWKFSGLNKFQSVAVHGKKLHTCPTEGDS